MKKQIQSPFAGGPRTQEDTDENGQPRITVWLTALTPLRVKIADRLAVACSALTVCAVPYGIFKIGEASLWQFETQQLWLLGGVLIAPAAVYFGVKHGLYDAFKHTVSVVFTPEHFVVKSPLGEKRFDRNQPHSFALYPHDKTKREEIVLSYRESKSARRWWQGARKRYYGRSGVLSFTYFDQRNDIRTIFGAQDCRDCLTRLTACSQVMDRYAFKGAKQALTPEGDWSSQSGDLHSV